MLTTIQSAPVRAALELLTAGLRDIYGPRLEKIALFGSHARGDASPDSDIDVAIVLAGDFERLREAGRTSDLRLSVMRETGQLIDLAFLSRDQWRNPAKHGPIYRDLRRDAVLL
jgi:predicted nucleotidyltransferase